MTQLQLDKIQELFDLEDGLSEWEIDFLENIFSNWRDRDLTEKQEQTLEKIYERLC